MVTLANQIPLVMAPAALCASIIFFSIVVLAYRAMQPATKAMVCSVMLALFGYALIMVVA